MKDESLGGVALGKPRVRKATTPPPALVPARSSRNTGATPASPGNSSRPGSYDPGSYNPGSYNRPAQRFDPADQSWDDDQQSTMAFDRDAADVLPGGGPNRPTLTPRQISVAPIPHFRPAAANAAVQTVIVPNQTNATGSTDARANKGAPLALWIFAAILAGVLSYHVTPAVMTHFEAPPAKTG